jgi:nucleoid DNA-binding protein
VDITAFIRELLFGHDCVIIPGFGAFIGNYNPAWIEKKSGTFHPPVKQISYNRNLIHNDGLLVGRIAGFSGMNYSEAKVIVDEFAGDTRRKLESGEKVVFDHIGSFVNNQEGNVQFEPDRSANYHLDSYGMESFQMMPLERYDLRARVVKPLQKNPQREAHIRKILWRAAVIVPLLSVLVIVPLKTDLFRSKIESSSMNPLVSAEFEQNRMAIEKGAGTIKAENQNAGAGDVSEETANNEITEVPVADAGPEAVAVSPVVAEPAKPAVAKTGGYYLITGSFQSENNAVKQVDMLKEEGFSPEIVLAPNGFYRVCAMTCRDLGTAKTKKDSISAKFPEAWISRKK